MPYWPSFRASCAASSRTHSISRLTVVGFRVLNVASCVIDNQSRTPPHGGRETDLAAAQGRVKAVGE